jgi:hypothetical protein
MFMHSAHCRVALAPLRQQAQLRRRSAALAVPVVAAASTAMPASTPPAAPSWPVGDACMKLGA